MPSPSLTGRQRDALMQHLDSLFALAQVVTPDPQKAVELVEATYQRAFSAPAHAGPSLESDTPPIPSAAAAGTSAPSSQTSDADLYDRTQTWLSRMMLQVRAEQLSPRRGEQPTPSMHEQEPPAQGEEPPTQGEEPPTQREGPPTQGEENPPPQGEENPLVEEIEPDLTDLRLRLTNEIIDRVVPPAFVTLPSRQRVLLMLCDVQGMSCRDAAAVLSLDADTACRLLDEAHAWLERTLRAQAAGPERRLLEAGLRPNWQQDAIRRMADSRFIVVPPTLRPAVTSIFKGVVEPGGAATEPREPAAQAGRQPVRAARSGVGLLMKFLAVVAVIGVAGLLGYAFTYFTQQKPNVNLISLSARHAQSVEASFQTTSPEQAERYIFDRVGNRVRLPTIEGAALEGVSIRPIVEGADVPVILFRDASGSSAIAVYVYSYSFLDQHRDDLVLERDILRQIEAEGNFDLHDFGEEKALVWRSRDDIFIAITRGDADALRDRIQVPS